MSPKKAHEVFRLASLIRDVASCDSSPSQLDFSSASTPPVVSRVVDAGAGQGYISRELAYPTQSEGSHFVGMEVLALEYNEIQLKGARRRDKNSPKPPSIKGDGEEQLRGSIVYRRVWISTESLANEIDLWISQQLSRPPSIAAHPPYPIMFTGLHTCGSLTSTVLRSFVQLSLDERILDRSWYPHSLVLVGCCYNLIPPSGLSEYLLLHSACKMLTHIFYR
jgi:hypothetical protein